MFVDVCKQQQAWLVNHSRPARAPVGAAVKPMLGRLGRPSLLPQLLHGVDSRCSSRGLLQHISSAAGVDGASSSSSSSSSSSGSTSSLDPSIMALRKALNVLDSSIRWETQQNYINAQGTEQSFAAYAASALSHMHQSMAAAVCSSSSSSSSRSTGMYSDLAPNLLRYVELLGQYDKWSVSQRRQMLDAIQTQLLPQMNALLGVPYQSSTAAAAAHSRASTPAIAASGLDNDHQEPQQQQQPDEATQQQETQQQASQQAPPPQQQQQPPARRLGPRRLGPAPRRQLLPTVPLQQLEQQQQQPVQAATKAAAAAAAAAPPQQQQTQQDMQQAVQVGGGNTAPAAPAAAQQQAAQQQATQTAPSAVQQQQQQQVRRIGPKRPPGARPLLRTQSAAESTLSPLHQQQQQQPPGIQPPPQQLQPGQGSAPTSSSSSSSVSTSPPRPLARTTSAAGPYLPRRHAPYPPHTSLAEVTRLHQQQRQLQGQQGLLPAWQLYFPLPEALGGPARPQAVSAAAAETAGGVVESATAAAMGDSASAAGMQQQQQQQQQQAEATGSESDEDTASSSSSSKAKGPPRDRTLTEQKWQALVASAQRWHTRVQQELQHRSQEEAGQLKQRTSAWLQMREGRLTGSILPNMLSWFGGTERDDMLRLWREKLGLQERPPPNEKMMYGTRQEARAMSSYQQLAPHEMLDEKGFALWGTDNAHDWLAASPDGLITASGLAGAAVAASAGVSEEVVQWVRQQTGVSLSGVLEIKCPYKASPQVDSPQLPSKMDPYYMPQVQVLCEVLDREWAVVYYWSEGRGSHMTLVQRDRGYFALLWRAMADFWWRHLVPAKLQLDADATAADRVEEQYRPRIHPYRAELIRRSKALVEAAPQRTFTAEQTMGLAVAAAAAPDTAACGDAGTVAAGAGVEAGVGGAAAGADAAGADAAGIAGTDAGADADAGADGTAVAAGGSGV